MLRLQNLSGPGLDADIALPSLDTLHAHDTFELDFQLSCPGDRDKDCPIWDHTVQLFVCCKDASGRAPPCEACGPTVWSKPVPASSLHQSAYSTADWHLPWPHKEHSPSWLSSSSQHPNSSSSSAVLPQCGRELGRWITPFRSRSGSMLCILCFASFKFGTAWCCLRWWFDCTVALHVNCCTAYLIKQQYHVLPVT